jgi:ATP-dependent RNA helicase RhlB
MDFTDFNLNADLMKGIQAAGYVTCTPVQEEVFKTALDGSDLYVQSQTGTGKTAAYLISIIQEILSGGSNTGKKVLIMVPTRELAVQVEEEADTLIGGTNLKAFSFYGGIGYEKQIDALNKSVDIIVGTPGRLIDLEESHHLNLSNVGFLVIDEADRMFDMGFYPDLRTLLKVLPKTEDRQTMLFSATLNSYVKNLAWEYTREAKEITIAADNVTVDQIDQELLHVSSDEKMKLLIGILTKEKPESVLVFCNTKRACEVVSKRLLLNGIQSEFIIGDLPQTKRQQVLDAFKAGKVSCLVATDVAARGIDVCDLSMVVNYDLPNEAENYVHRIGRTARAGKTGKAYTFCSEQDVYNLPAIERYIEMQIPAKVADPDRMAEDKSAGVYIRTENWHEDYDESRGGTRREEHRGSSYHDHKSGTDRQRVGGHRRVDTRHEERVPDKRRKEYSTDKRRFPVRREEDPKKLQNMSFDERMKLYKEKYTGTASKVKQFNKKQFDHKETNSGKKVVQVDNKKSTYTRSSTGKQYNPDKKGLQSQSLIARVKRLFSKKNKTRGSK